MSQHLKMAGHTVTYNGVQVGGSESRYSWYPPTTRFEITPEYDDAGRTVVRERVVMSLSAILVHDTEADQDRQVAEIRRKLNEPGKRLQIAGMGMGFLGTQIDTSYGPRTRSLSLSPLAPLSCTLDWVLEFTVHRCASTSNIGVFESLVFSSDWTYDREGKATRSIQGKVTIPKLQISQSQVHIDAIRDRLKFVIPNNFERVATRFAQSLNKLELTFSVVDRELTGSPLPVNIIDGSGQRAMQTAGPGFVNGVVSLSMALTTAPGVPRGWAALHFFREVMATQKNIAKSSSKKMALVPQSLSVVHSLFGRESAFSFTWIVSGCLMDLLMSEALYAPVQGTNYQQWYLSVKHLWGNRGFSELYENPKEDVIIDVCSGTTTATIGGTGGNPKQISKAGKGKIFCDDITEENSWLTYDTTIKAKVSQAYSEHLPASAFEPPETDNANGVGFINRGDSSQSLSTTDENPIVETVGRPVQRFLLQWRGLRVKYQPEPPKLVSIGGRKAQKVRHYTEAPKIVTMALGCPVYYARSATEYIVTEPVEKIGIIQRETLCTTQGSKDRT